MKKRLPASIILTLLMLGCWAPNAYAVSPLLTNLNAYWKFDESSGNALDATGNGTTLTNNNTITYVAGLINNAASLNGSTQFFSTASNSFLTITQDFTIAVWVNPNFSPSGGTQYVIANKEGSYGLRYERNKPGDGNVSGLDFMLNTTGNNAALAEISTPAVGGDYLSQNVWHLIVFTRTQSTGIDTIYLDGTQIVSQSDSAHTALNSNSNVYQMGQNAMTFTNGGYFTNAFWSGKIDHTGLWSRALTSTEVTQLYNSRGGLQYPFSPVVKTSLGQFFPF